MEIRLNQTEMVFYSDGSGLLDSDLAKRKLNKIWLIRLVGIPKMMLPRKKMEAEGKTGSSLVISTGS